MANITDAWVDPVRRAIGTDPASTNVASTLTYNPNATYTPITPSMYVGSQTINGTLSPAISPYLAGPVVAGSAPLANPSFKATPASTNVPIYGTDGTVIGYTQTTYSWDGTPTVTTNMTPGAASSSSSTILANKLLAAGLPQSTVDKAKSYFQTLLTDGVSMADAIDYFYYQPTYTGKSGQTITSPYQTDFGKFNTGLAQAKDPKTLVNWVLGMRDVGTKYNLAASYTSDDALSQMIKNNVSVANFDDRASQAQLKAVTADPFQVSAMKQLGYISGATDLTGFYLDPSLAQTEFEKRAKTAALGTEAARMQNRFMTFDSSFIQKQAADLAAQGYSESQIAALANKNYAGIAANIEPATTIAGIYGKSTGNLTNIQDILQQQAFNNVTNTGLQTAAQMEAAAFQGGAGTTGTSAYLRKTSQQQPGSEVPFQY